MPFHAINSLEDDLLDQAALHTLELQLETALKMFESALDAQKKANFWHAKSIYDELFALEVLHTTDLKHIPSSAFRLRGLCLKNYALLQLSILQVEVSEGHVDSSNRDAIRQRLLPIVETVAEALEFTGSDTSLQDILGMLALALGHPRLTRLCLEASITDVDHHAVSMAEAASSRAVANYSGFTPKDRDLYVQLKELMVSLGDSVSLSSDLFKSDIKTLPVLRRDYSWINANVDARDSREQMWTQLNSVSDEILLTTKEWPAICAELDDVVSGGGRKRKRTLIPDLYAYSTRPAQRVKFVSPHGDPMVVDSVDRNTSRIVELPQDSDTSMIVSSPAESREPTAEPPSADAPLRAETDVCEIIEPQTSRANGDASARKAPSIESERVIRAQTISDFESVPEFGAQATAFAGHMASYLQLTGLQYQSVTAVFTDPDACALDPWFPDFKRLLADWDDDQATVFLRSGAPDISASQGVMQMLDFAALGAVNTASKFRTDPGQVDAFLAKIGDGVHIQTARMLLLESLLSSSDPHVPSPSLQNVWPAEMMDSVLVLIESLEDKLFDLPHGAFSLEQVEMMVAVYELYVDRHVKAQRDSRARGESPKTAAAAAEREDLENERLLRWRGASGDMLLTAAGNTNSELRPVLRKLALRHQWASIFCDEDTPEESMDKFGKVKKAIEVADFAIDFANYSTVPVLSAASCDMQISKYRAASYFAKVFEQGDGDEDPQEAISLLESMLIPESAADAPQVPEHEAILQFLASASSDFKLSLWYVLLDNYENVGSKERTRDGLVRILRQSLVPFNKQSYASKPRAQREEIILQALSTANDVGRRLLPLLVSDEKLVLNMSVEEARSNLKDIVFLLELLYVSMFNDQAINSNFLQAPHHQSWERALAKLRETAVCWWTIFYLFYRSALNPEARTKDVLNDILSIIHDQLGVLGYCGLNDGSLLDLNIREILRLDWPDSEADMIQCLNCHYGLTMSTEHFSPFNHHNVPVELTRDVAIGLTKFIMRMILSKKSLGQYILRAEVRQTMDAFGEALGDPTASNYQVNQNQLVLDAYLDKAPTASLLRDAWTGRLQLALVPCMDPKTQELGEGGFYFVMGLLQLTQFKIRRRNGPGRLEDLEEAIKYFRYDLVHATNHVEAWMGLSQAYDMLAEERILWSPLGLEIPDEVKAVQRAQQKAILAAAMATSMLRQSNRPPPLSGYYFEQLKSQIWSYYGRLLFYACISPMNMGAFTVDLPTRFVFADNQHKDVATAAVSKQSVLKLALNCFVISQKETPRDWLVHYLGAKTAHLLNQPVETVLDQLVIAAECRTADSRESKSSQEAPFEPSQALILLSELYAREGKLSKEKALEYMAKSNFVPPPAPPRPEPITTPTVLPPSPGDKEKAPKVEADFTVTKTAIESLKGVQNADKKNWLHRPAYWIAHLYDKVLSDSVEAEAALGSLFTVKTNARNPINIWKPESERPGQHFVYVYEYVVYFTDLLYTNKRDADLATLARKTRRFTSMIDHQKAWDHLTSQTTKLVREILAFPLRYSDKVMASLDPVAFAERSSELDKWIEDQKNAPALNPWILALDYALELRKLNNGYGSTVPIDDIAASCYLKLYITFKPMPLEKPKETADVSASGTPQPPSDTVAVTGSIFAGIAAPTNSGGIIAEPQKDVSKAKSRLGRKEIVAKAQQALKPLQARLAKLEPRSIPRELEGKGGGKVPEIMLSPRATSAASPVDLVDLASSPVPRPVSSATTPASTPVPIPRPSHPPQPPQPQPPVQLTFQAQTLGPGQPGHSSGQVPAQTAGQAQGQAQAQAQAQAQGQTQAQGQSQTQAQPAAAPAARPMPGLFQRFFPKN